MKVVRDYIALIPESKAEYEDALYLLTFLGADYSKYTDIDGTEKIEVRRPY